MPEYRIFIRYDTKSFSEQDSKEIAEAIFNELKNTLDLEGLVVAVEETKNLTNRHRIALLWGRKEPSVEHG